MKEKNSISKSQEYDSLRSELLQNKQYVFERPLLIITGFGIAATQLTDATAINLLPPLLIAISFINLWFTVNRLRSIARIAAYIQIFLEPNSKYEWIGWENSLQVYRAKNHENVTNDKQNQKKSNGKKSPATSNSMIFYGPLLYLHMLMVVIAVTASIYTTLTNQNTFHNIISGITITIGILFFVVCLVSWRPRKMKKLIDGQLKIWEMAFQKLEKKK